jgi:hypothetical protein
MSDSGRDWGASSDEDIEARNKARRSGNPLQQCACGSYAINPHLHGRMNGIDMDKCDVCYWRSAAESAIKFAERTAQCEVFTFAKYANSGWTETPEQMLDRWSHYDCKCDDSVGFVCEVCHDTRVVKDLMQTVKDLKLAVKSQEELLAAVKKRKGS